MEIRVDGAFADVTSGDALLLIAGFNQDRHADRGFVARLKKVARRFGTVAGIESGCWLLARSGLLDGRDATAHWEELEDFSAAFPALNVRADRFVTDGPLKEFEHRFLEHLAAMEKPVLVCLNKEDWFLPEDRDRLLAQIAEHLDGLVPAANIVALRAQPAARVRTRVIPDGTQCDESVEVEPDIRALADRMRSIVKRDGRDLLLANLLLQSRGLVAEAKAQLQTELDKQAREIVDRSMWQAGAAAAFASAPSWSRNSDRIAAAKASGFISATIPALVASSTSDW